jgi:hypothetical protein
LLACRKKIGPIETFFRKVVMLCKGFLSASPPRCVAAGRQDN